MSRKIKVSMYKKKKHIFLLNRNKNNKGIIEEIDKAYEMTIAMPLHIMPLIEKTLYELCDVRTSISPLQGDVQGSNPSRFTN